MKFISKKFVVMLLVVAMALSISLPATAAGNESDYADYIVVTDDVIKKIVIEWAEYVIPNLTFDVSGIYEYYNLDDELIGYSVSVTSDGVPYGYVILDFFQENIITEFAIEKGAVNICESALLRLQNNADASDLICKGIDADSVRLHKYLPLEYAVSVEVGGNEVYAIGEEIVERKEYRNFSDSILASQFSSANSSYKLSDSSAVYNKNSQNATVYGHCSQIMLEEIPTGYTAVDPLDQLSSTKSFSQSWAETNTNSYACAIVAGLNIMHQNNCLLNSNDVDTYNWLWKDTGTTETTASKNNSDSDIVYGGTTVGKIAPSIVKLAKQLGHTSSSYTTVNPGYQVYKTAIKAGKSGILEFGITVNASGGGTERQGHTVSVVGYRSDKDSSSTVHQYIVVADGWGAYRNMELSAIDFVDVSGATIKIS